MTELRTNSNGIGVDIGGKAPDNWESLGEILFEIEVTCVPELAFKFKRIKRPDKPSPPIKNHKPSKSIITSPDLSYRDPSPLDFTLRAPCLVYIGLANSNLYFTPTMTALTTREDCKDKYYELVHFSEDLDTLTDTAPNKCKWIAFAAICPRKTTGDPVKDNDAFNLNVQVVNTVSMTDGDGNQISVPLKLDLIIDPDIKNDGGHPYPPPPGYTKKTI